MKTTRNEHATVHDLSPEWREWYEERAAIRQFDANMSRDEAERMALADVRQVMERRRVKAEAAGE